MKSTYGHDRKIRIDYMQDAKTRRLMFFVMIPAIIFSFIGGVHVSDFAKGLTEGILIGIQLLLVLKLKRHKILTKTLES
ncbi:hypothetical protein [Gluconobacter sp. P1D12_c]|uniref:hypothetical protein n=1 Tax=Gluconobacter sp. P1D12_c TaxID=2762614 RepID=UPI001C04F873|nr:hypothetical protein [Gluconobacter sp. P1D12_c]